MILLTCSESCRVLYLWVLNLIYHGNCRYEFKNNHGKWVSTVRPDLGPGISERVREALETTDDDINICLSVKTELRSALTALLGVNICS